MEEPATAAKAEVVDHRPVVADGLGAHARGPEPDLVRPDVRQVALHLADVGALGEVAPHLGGAHPPEPGRQSLEAPERERAGEIAQVDVGALVAFAGERENGVRAGPHGAIVARREVNPEEWEARIGNWVEESRDQRAGVRRERVVVAAERHDPRDVAADVAAHGRHAVGVEPGTRDDVGRIEVAGRGFEGHPVGSLPDPGHFAARVDDGAGRAQVLGVGEGHRAEVDYAGPRRPEATDPGGPRFELADPLRSDLLEAIHAVRGGAVADVGQSRQLLAGQRDDELARVADRDPVCLGVGFECGLALAAERRLERSRRVIQAGVDHARVVPRLVGREGRLLLEDGDAEARSCLQEPQSRGETDDPASDDGHIRALTHCPNDTLSPPSAAHLEESSRCPWIPSNAGPSAAPGSR